MKILFDSDVLFALYVPHDANHIKSKRIFSTLDLHSGDLFVSDHVIQETATVLSRKVNQTIALDFYYSFTKLNVNHIQSSPDVLNQAWQIFLDQTKKSTSFIDCLNVAIFQEYQLDAIFSFDTFYPRLNLPICQ